MTDEQIDKSIEKNELQLNSWGKFKHYCIVGFMLLIPTYGIFLCAIDLANGIFIRINREMLFLIIIPAIMGFLFYKLQRKRLKFNIVKTNLTRIEIDKIINIISIAK